jgi:N-acetylneuraminic acid mutarotase
MKKWNQRWLLCVGVGALSCSLSTAWSQTNQWVFKEPMPTARTLVGGCELNGQFYVTGGAINESSLSAKVEVYDPPLDTWTTKSRLPSLLCGHAICVRDGKIYVFGGLSPAVSSPATKRVYSYDPQTDTWMQKSDMPTANAWCAVAVIDSIIYLFGGAPAVPGIPFRTVLAYDPAKETWTRKADMPTARFGLSACVSAGKVYVIGGCANGYSPLYKTVEAYDPVSDTWTRKADMPTGRFGLATTLVGNQIYATGGISASGAAHHELYSISENRWTIQPPLQQKRLGLFVGKVGHCLYAIGGSFPSPTPTMFPTVEEYDLWGGGGPMLTITSAPGMADLELRWQPEKPIADLPGVLQRADSPPGPWNDFVTDAQSRVVVPMTNPASFFRIRAP